MADALRERAERYVFVSSVSVYADFATPNHEDSPLGTIDDVHTDVVNGRTYGPLKALCERALLERSTAASTLIVRPGLVVGPYDPTQRFTYWPARIARADNGEPCSCQVRRSILFSASMRATWRRSCSMALKRATLALQAASPAGQWTMGELLDTCARRATHTPVAWADASALASLGLNPWSDLPLWLEPQGDTRPSHAPMCLPR